MAASKLAAAIGITVQALSQWGRVPAKRVLSVEALTGVSRYELRPDLHGSGPVNAPNILGPDNIADRTGGPCPNPIAGIELSPQLDGLPARCGEESRGASQSSVTSSDKERRECAEEKS
ncbi:transcriptional regulator [Bradyrhizobium sp. 195]|uniref:transcriptional regulator n=1 Tax=Bradyrhizobium sp. 195 TaxID=2782662 RepID=UPI0020009A58|nr:YdaS family helix-turn-helix protein [Bradyrhizobium sp. 195]